MSESPSLSVIKPDETPYEERELAAGVLVRVLEAELALL
jgi:hypothetical protein